MLVACTAAVLVGVMRLDSWVALSMVPGAWSVSCADWRSFMLVAGVPCLLCSLAVPGVWSSLPVTRADLIRRQNKPGAAQEPTQAATSNAREDNRKNQCGTADTICQQVSSRLHERALPVVPVLIDTSRDRHTGNRTVLSASAAPSKARPYTLQNLCRRRVALHKLAVSVMVVCEEEQL